ncbi:MAG: fused MFS/spermidine synthase [Fulvivirga sp.]
MKPINTQSSKSFIIFISVLFFISGAAGLILQVVWMYRLGLVFGNSAYATSATLAAFFLGLAFGGHFWGSIAAKFKHPLRLYGLMEIGIAITAILWLSGLYLYELYFPSIVHIVGRNQDILTLIKFIFSALLLLLPTMLMGGTFPVLVQCVSNSRSQMETHGSMLYAINTIGASIGTFITGFILLTAYGVNITYYFAVFTAAATGILATIVSSLNISPQDNLLPLGKIYHPKVKLPPIALSKFQVAAIAFVSGFLALSLEILWTRMFAQVLQNSVYSFAVVLIVFLISLGLAGLLSHVLIKYESAPLPTLIALLIIGAIGVALTPIFFNELTDGAAYLSSSISWNNYLFSIFKLSSLIVSPPTIVIGAIFPYLLKISPHTDIQPGKLTGNLVLFNSLGSAIGPVIVGFILLDVLGLPLTIRLVAYIYVFVAIVLCLKLELKSKTIALVSSLSVAVIFGLLNNPTLVKLENGEQMLAQWQSSDGIVTIVQTEDNIEMKLDNYYVLGDSKSVIAEQLQGHIPLLIHPNPKKVLFLGMGTGITAGASLNHNVDRVVVTELIGNVVTAAKQYFSPLTNSLFTDSRVHIIRDDARNYLLTSSEKYDVIIGDLFTPWHAGTGSLYTIEHFQEAKSNLTKDGLFAQWLPLHQLTPETLDIICKSFAAVFPQVTLWRADFSAHKPNIALIGQDSNSPLNNEVLKNNIVNVLGKKSLTGDHMAGLFYLGNYKGIKHKGIEINTDDKRTIELKAPVLSYKATNGSTSYVTNETLEKYLSIIQKNLPPYKDSYVANLPESEKVYIPVGYLYFKYLNAINKNDTINAQKFSDQIESIVPGFFDVKL